MARLAQTPADNLVGHYQILCQVGAGGMGKVFKAFDTQLQRTVALKFLTADPTKFIDHESLLREARAASTLDHKNIASVHAVEETDDGQLFIVMTYYEGQSLSTRMNGAPLSPREAVEIIRQIAEGLAHAHLHNLVHRDIKPSNVILTSEGEAKIVDFGLARFVSPTAPTQTLSLAGTLCYMSPEQVSGMAVDARTDIWSLGVIAYQLLTNRLPFPDNNPASTVNAILHSPPAELEGVPRELQWIVQRALAKRLPDRYQSCAELLRDLETTAIPADRSTTRSGKLAFRRFASLALAVRLQAALTEGRRWTLLVALVLLAGTVAVSFRKQVLPVQNAQPEIPPAAYESYLQGRQYLDRYDKPGNLDASIRLFETTTKADPKFALAFAALGEAYWEKYALSDDPRWVQLASSACQRAAELNNQLPAVYVTLGRIHSGTGMHDLAIQEFQRARELDHHNPDALLGLADAYANVGRTQEAEDAYKRAAAMRPADWDGHYRLGAFYYSQHRFPEAATQFHRVIELLPDHVPAHTGLGTTLISLGKEDEAEAEFKKALALAPDYVASSNLGVIYYNHKRFAEAAAMTEQALQLNDKDYRLWNNLAIAYEWLGQPDKARQAFHQELSRLEQIVPLRPYDAEVQANLGVMYSQLHLRDKASAHLEAALAISPDEAEILGRAGEVYENLGERVQALEYFQKALRKGWVLEDLETNPDLRSLLSDRNARRALQEALPSTAKPQTSATR
jgi:eukaryotic-like serine/threonine-protein kinase